MKVDEHAIRLAGWDGVHRSDYADRYTCDVGRCDIHRVDGTVRLRITKLHSVCLRTLFRQGLLRRRVRYRPGEILLSLWTDCLRQRNDATNMRSALRVDIARIPLRYRRTRLLSHTAVRTRGE